MHTSEWLPELAGECDGCGKCVRACPVDALSLVSAHDPKRPSARMARLEADRCLGCGVCARACTRQRIHLRRRGRRVLTPANTAHRAVMMAIERGTFAELLVDGQSTYGHRAVAAILGAVLKLPPLKQALASEQVKSRFFGRMLARNGR